MIEKIWSDFGLTKITLFYILKWKKADSPTMSSGIEQYRSKQVGNIIIFEIKNKFVSMMSVCAWKEKENVNALVPCMYIIATTHNLHLTILLYVFLSK